MNKVVDVQSVGDCQKQVSMLTTTTLQDRSVAYFVVRAIEVSGIYKIPLSFCNVLLST
jgi:hypothetical protein